MNFGGDTDNQEVMSEINMTPLVDVMLVLLIIFIITLPVLTHSVKIDLPRASNTPNQIKPETITLSITDNEKIHWNNDIITPKELQQRLDVIAIQEPQPEVQLRGERHIEYEHIIKVMTAVQRAGILKLGFITEPSQ